MVGISFYSEVYNCNQTKEGEMNMLSLVANV